MRYEYLYKEAVVWVKDVYYRMAGWVLALGGVTLIIMWWMLLPPNLPNIPQEGKAERARQLELVKAELSKKTVETEEEVADAIPSESSPIIEKQRAATSAGKGRLHPASPMERDGRSPAKDIPPKAEQVQLDPMVKLGMKVYKEFECYNCHKIAGKGNKKRKGPELDNIGNLVSAELLKKKLLDPWVFSTEGYDKEYQKPVMPNNYPKLMTEKEMDAVVAYMLTLKNAAAKTPKPIFDVKRPDL